MSQQGLSSECSLEHSDAADDNMLWLNVQWKCVKDSLEVEDTVEVNDKNAQSANNKWL